MRLEGFSPRETELLGIAVAAMETAGYDIALIQLLFTHPAPNEYRTWFVCENCNFETRAQNSGRPPFYSEERDRTAKASAS